MTLPVGEVTANVRRMTIRFEMRLVASSKLVVDADFQKSLLANKMLHDANLHS